MDFNSVASSVSQAKPITGIYWIFGILLFGGVIVFVIIYFKAFWTAFKQGEIKEDYNKNDKFEMRKNIIKNKMNICKYCGTPIESDSNFCKNCGNRIK